MADNLDINWGDKVTQEKASKPDTGLLAFLNKDIKLFSSKLSDQRKEWIYQQLAVLLDANVELKTCLELIEQEAVKEKDIIKSIRLSIMEGQSLADAFQQTGKFTQYEIQSLKIGEASGQLHQIFISLAQFYQGQVKINRQIISILSYPLVILFVAFGTIYFMLTVVVPLFKDVFKQVGSEMPAATKLVISMSESVNKNAWWFFLLILAIAVFTVINKKKMWWRKASAAIVLKIPLIGAMVKDIYILRFSRAMHLLLSSGTMLVDALNYAQSMIGFYPMEETLKTATEKITNGAWLHESLGIHGLFPQKYLSIIKAGEEVNQMTKIFKKMSDQIDDSLQHKNEMIGKMIEPIFIIIMGLVIGFILVAMYLPLFNISTSLKM
jgi:type IV pilus assembly protein PilC